MAPTLTSNLFARLWILLASALVTTSRGRVRPWHLVSSA